MSAVAAALLGATAGLEGRHAALLARDGPRARRAAAVAALRLGALVASLWYCGFTLPRILGGIGKFGFIFGLMMPPSPQTWANAQFYLVALAQTVAIAFVGTLVAAALALPVSFLAARNVVASRVVRLLSRRLFDSIRGVDTLIWALIWINVVGLGPFAGALAIVTSDFGALAKLFSEAIETADAKPVDGVLSSGASRLQSVRFALLPQLLPVVLSQVLYFFESNTRASTVLGIVGAGGIGLPLSEMIRTDEWQQTAFILLLLLATVAAIDWVSARVRLALIGTRA